jgi:uncharacterized membrane protein YphA (DoxX/SURF4 family)
MYLLERINVWSQKHHPVWIDAFRVMLGFLLLWKGIYFVINKQAVVEIVQTYGFGFYTMTLAHIVIGVHIAGGVMIIAGLLTRLAVLFQLPVVLSSLFFVVLPGGFMSFRAELELTILVLALLGLFLVEGSGSFSVDGYMKRHPEG